GSEAVTRPSRAAPVALSRTLSSSIALPPVAGTLPPEAHPEARIGTSRSHGRRAIQDLRAGAEEDTWSRLAVHVRRRGILAQIHVMTAVPAGAGQGTCNVRDGGLYARNTRSHRDDRSKGPRRSPQVLRGNTRAEPRQRRERRGDRLYDRRRSAARLQVAVRRDEPGHGRDVVCERRRRHREGAEGEGRPLRAGR